MVIWTQRGFLFLLTFEIVEYNNLNYIDDVLQNCNKKKRKKCSHLNIKLFFKIKDKLKN